MITLLKKILYYISCIFFISEKDEFIKKSGIQLRKTLLKIYSFLPCNKLNFFFLISGSDKYEQYSDLYEIIGFLLSRNKKLTILEIGIGGHDKKFSGGNSVIALKYIFKNSKIIGFDYEDKKFLDDDRIKTYRGDQSNKIDLLNVVENEKEFDLIIDDGSHFVNHQKISFEFLYNYLKVGGIYVIEDIQSSYANAMNGDPNLGIDKNIVSFFSKFIHSTNREFLQKKFINEIKPYEDFSKVFFFKNAIVVQKQSKNFKSYPESELFFSLDEMNKLRSKVKTEHGVIMQNKD